MTLRTVGLFALSCGLAAAAALGQGPPPLGEEFRVNTYTPGGQIHPAVAADPSGNFVVVWSSEAQDGSFHGLFGQRYDASGARVGGEFPVNSYTTSSQLWPAVAADSSGDFVVVWMSYGQDGSYRGIFGRRFDGRGTPLGDDFQVNTYTTGDQDLPDVASDVEGDFVVVWHGEGQDDQSFGIFGQRYSADGQPLDGQFQVNTYTPHDQGYPEVAVGVSGDFVVTWMSEDQDGSGGGIFARRFDSSGRPVGDEFQVNTYTTAWQNAPEIALGPAGEFVVVWQDQGQDGSTYTVVGQRFSAEGEPLGKEFQVNTYTTNMQAVPGITVDGVGSFVVTWISYWQDGSYWGVFGQRYDAQGTRLGSEFQVNTQTAGFQTSSAVAADPSGRFVVVWTSGDVFGQRYLGPVFADGFESGDTSAWDQTVP